MSAATGMQAYERTGMGESNPVRVSHCGMNPAASRLVIGVAAGFNPQCRNARESEAKQGTWGRSPRAGGHGGCPPINSTYSEAEQRESDAQPLECVIAHTPRAWISLQPSGYGRHISHRDSK